MIYEPFIDKAHRYSKSGLMRLRATWMACAQVDHSDIPGAFVECGVWRGGNVMVARWASPLRHCWLYDTFEGMTEPGKYDIKNKPNSKPLDDSWIGKLAVSVEDVILNLNYVGVYDREKIRMVKGDVRKTLLEENNLPEQIAVLRLDTDLYDSTKIEMEVLYPRLSVGGFLIVDDFGHWQGARKAVIDYLGKKSKALKPIDYTGVWMQKE